MLVLEGVSIFYKIKTLIHNTDEYLKRRKIWKTSGAAIKEYGDDWPNSCYDGVSQSPIDINTATAESAHLPPIKLGNYEVPQEAFIENTGHSVKISLRRVPVTISDGILTSEYILDNVHFHWNSEHTINGRKFPLEAHFVHYLKEAGNLSNALDIPNGVAAFAVFYEFTVDETETKIFKEIGNNTEFIATKYHEPRLFNPRFVLKKLLPNNINQYYTYEGSLTTPNCNETMLWIVFPEPSKITLFQFASLKGIYNEQKHPILRNARPLQPLNGRTVKYVDAQDSCRILSSPE